MPLTGPSKALSVTDPRSNGRSVCQGGVSFIDDGEGEKLLGVTPGKVGGVTRCHWCEEGKPLTGPTGRCGGF